MGTIVKRVLKVLGIVLAAIVLVVGGYIGYLQGQYNRLADHATLVVTDRVQTPPLKAGHEYTAATYNVGFGAYTPDYTFFMDEGVMDDGTPMKGEHGIAASKESVEATTNGAVKVLAGLDPDFMLLQEVDEDSTRSWHVNQELAFVNSFADTAFTYAVNFHTGFLAYPWPEMHGIVNAGLLTLSKYSMDSAERRSYPVDESFITKFFDLDRCFSVQRLPVENGKELVLINSHMSAYDEGGLVRVQQLEMLNGVLAEEYAKGNYVVAGGDWNHALCGSVDLYPSKQQIPAWVSVLDTDDLADGFHVVRADNLASVPTCRGCDIPYEEGVTYTTTVDGFIVSDNVDARAQNIDTAFANSDHNPVQLTFTLKK